MIFTCMHYRTIRDQVKLPESFGDSCFKKSLFSANLQDKKQSKMQAERTEKRERNVKKKKNQYFHGDHGLQPNFNRKRCG